MEERLNELEVRYEYQQRQMEALSQALYEQQRAFDKVSARLDAVERRVAQLYALLDSEPGNEPPPHY